MKLVSEIDAEAQVARVTIEFSTIEEASKADDFFHAVARVLHPDIVFTGEPGFDEAEPAEGRGEGADKPRKQRDFTKLPRPGSTSDRVRNFVLTRQQDDPVVIAEALDLQINFVCIVLGQLRLGGHLPSQIERKAA